MENSSLPFADGTVAYHKTFLGREKEIQELEEVIFTGCGAVHLVGPPRIGKTSLVYAVCEKNRDYPNRLCVKISMGEAVNAYDFWINLSEDILEEISDAELWDKKYQRQQNQIADRVSEEDLSWFTYLKRPLASILKHLKDTGCQLVLIIDEFDKARTLFGMESAYFQFLRSIYSDPDYNTSGVIISRRRLSLLENDCPDISTFHGVFSDYTLQGFSEDDIAVYAQRLGEYGIALSQEGWERLKYYTGTIPYLCCKLGNQMVRDSRDGGVTGDVDTAFHTCLPKFNEYYDDLIIRLKEDGQMDLCFYLSIGMKPPTVTKREWDNMISMGILTQKKGTADPQYYVYTQDFMTYVRDLPLELSTWEMIQESEKKLRAIFQERYPRLAVLSCAELEGEQADKIRNELNREYPDLRLDWNITMKYLRTNAIRDPNAHLLGAISLPFVVNKIIAQWDTFFARYFEGDVSWKGKLETIKNVRIPVAHSNIELIDPKELTVCMQYCDELIRLEVG